MTRERRRDDLGHSVSAHVGAADVIVLTGASAHVGAMKGMISKIRANPRARATDTTTSDTNVSAHVGAAGVTALTSADAHVSATKRDDDL